MKKILFYSILLLSLCLSACVKDFDLGNLHTEPRLVMNADFVPGVPVEVELSRTWFLGSQCPDQNMEGAEVNMWVNDRFQETLSLRVITDSLSARSVYRSDYLPQEGDRIRIEAEKAGFPSVSAADGFPSLCRVDSFTFVRNILEEDTLAYLSNVYGECTLSFTDDPGREDYYAVSVWARDTIDGVEYHRPSSCYSADSLFTVEGSLLDDILDEWSWSTVRPDFYFFSDRKIDSRPYQLAVTVYNGMNFPVKPDGSLARGSYFVRLYCLSEAYYRFLYSLSGLGTSSVLQNFAENGLAEPYFIYSNVAGGLGFVGAYQYIDLPIR